MLLFWLLLLLMDLHHRIYLLIAIFILHKLIHDPSIFVILSTSILFGNQIKSLHQLISFLLNNSSLLPYALKQAYDIHYVTSMSYSQLFLYLDTLIELSHLLLICISIATQLDCNVQYGLLSRNY
jgi:hypothetical protein